MGEEGKPEVTPDLATLAARLSEAQRRAVLTATYQEKRGAWSPAGWYVSGDKRVRLKLTSYRLTPDYLRRSNRLTPLGEQVRTHLKDENR